MARFDPTLAKVCVLYGGPGRTDSVTMAIRPIREHDDVSGVEVLRFDTGGRGMTRFMERITRDDPYGLDFVEKDWSLRLRPLTLQRWTRDVVPQLLMAPRKTFASTEELVDYVLQTVPPWR